MQPNHAVKSDATLGFPFASAADSADLLNAAIIGAQSGDLMYYDAASGTVKPANTFTWGASESATQRAFANAFAGVAIGGVRKDDPEREEAVSAFGQIYQVSVAAAAYEVGDLLGVAKQAGGNALERSICTLVTDPEAAIFRVVKKTGAGSTLVWAVPIFRLFGVVPDERIGSMSFTFDTEGDVAANTRTVTIQLKDRFGNNLAGVRSFLLWLAGTATGGVGTAPSGAVTATVGELAPITAKVHHYVTTNASGVAAFTVVEAGVATWFIRALVDGKVQTSAAFAFA